MPVLLLCFTVASISGRNESIPAELLLETIVDEVEVHETPIVDLLRLLAEQIDLNIIIGPDSMGTVSLRFSNVTLREALDAILGAKGFQYQLYGNILMVSQPDSLEKARGMGLKTQLFRLKYADARDVKSTIDTSKVLSPWGYTTISYRTINVGAAKISYLKPSLGAASNQVFKLEEPVQPGTTPLQARSDIIIVTDRPPVLKRISELIEVIDHPMRQVEIEVHFVETILGDNSRLGIDWTSILSAKGSYQGKTKWIFGDQPISDLLTGGGVSGTSDEGGSNLSTSETKRNNTVEFGSLSATVFTTMLDLMIKQERAKLLSQPHITTINNQPATISVGTTTWIEERSSAGESGGEVRITYNERQVPIELVVVPHILHNDRVMLELRPRVEEITGWQEASGGYQLPLISTRTSDSRVEVNNGETAVIGGLIKEKNLITKKRVWLLGSLPLIGHLFRHKIEAIERTDLTIFITPRIVELDKGAKESSSIPDFDRSGKRELDYTPNSKNASSLEQEEEVDMESYFPLNKGLGWSYLWREERGARWESRLKVLSNGKVVRIEENIPTGPHKAQAHSGYMWTEDGMVNLYRGYVNGDSVSYSPSRVVLPREMVIGKTYEYQYGWQKWDSSKRKKDSGEIIQKQRLVGKFTVTTTVGRFSDCLAVETISFKPGASEEQYDRKVVWYAKGIGPVKVEDDIPLEERALNGALSALLVKR